MTKCNFQQHLKTKPGVFIENAYNGALKLSGILKYPIIDWLNYDEQFPTQYILLNYRNDRGSIIIKNGNLQISSVFSGTVFIYKKLGTSPIHLSDIRYGSLNELIEIITKGWLI